MTAENKVTWDMGNVSLMAKFKIAHCIQALLDGVKANFQSQQALLL